VKREDFDVDKVKSKQGMTIAEWRDAYLKLEKSGRSDLLTATAIT
jgi:hypothetical protein